MEKELEVNLEAKDLIIEQFTSSETIVENNNEITDINNNLGKVTFSDFNESILIPNKKEEINELV